MKSTTNTLYQGMSGRLGDLIISQQQGQTVIRQRPGYLPRITDEQQFCQMAFQQATMKWKTLSPIQMLSWRTIAPKIPRWDAPAGAAPLSGQQAFVGTAMNRRVLFLPPLLLAPFVPSLPPFLPEWMARQIGTGTDFRLLLDTAAFDFPVQVLVTPLLSRGRDVVNVKRYATITVATGLPSGTLDLTETFRLKHGAPGACQHFGVRLCPLSAEEFRGRSVTQATVFPEDTADVSLVLR